MGDDLVEKVATTLNNVEVNSDWWNDLATAAISVMQPEIDRLRDEINILKSQIEYDAAVIERLQAELDNK